MFWVYVLENARGKFYVGQTENIAERVQDHNRTDCFEGHFTRKNGPWKLVWWEAHSSRRWKEFRRPFPLTWQLFVTDEECEALPH